MSLMAPPIPLCHASQAQRGIMLILLVFIIGIVATTYLLHALNAESIRTDRDLRTSKALAEARTALLGYAATYDDLHSGEVFGYLPCPDLSATDPNGEGSQSPCESKNVSVLGKLPWKTLDISPIRDGDGECLWFAVSGNYKSNPKTDDFSPNTTGLINVLAADGTSYLADSTNPAVAVIFAPGPVLNGQSRSIDDTATKCGGNYVASNYLDSDTTSNTNNAVVSSVANTVSTFIAATNSQLTANQADQFNDRLLIIRKSDVFAVYCKKYANTLLTHVSTTDSSNNCKNIAMLPICTAMANNLHAYCEPQTCKDAALTFISADCLEDLSSIDCQAAIGNLKACKYE